MPRQDSAPGIAHDGSRTFGTRKMGIEARSVACHQIGQLAAAHAAIPTSWSAVTYPSYNLNDPFILRYKDDPRFAAFCHKVGLPVPGPAPAPKSA